MSGKIHYKLQFKIFLILHLAFFTQHCIAFISEKANGIYPEKYEDLYDENKLENIVWMNIFSTYPTLNSDNSKSRSPNLTRDFFANDKNEYLKSFNEPEKVNLEDKFLGNYEKLKAANKFDLSTSNVEKSILETVEDSPLYQLCLRTVNVVETCLALILKSNNLRKIYVDKQYICGNLPIWFDIRQCLQQFQSDDNFSKFLEKHALMPVVKKNKKITDTPKRLPFHAWGGKRFNQVGTEKIQTSRVPFNAWGGKRKAEYEQSFNPFAETCEPCKRSKAKFHSWGGKRSKRKATI